MSAISLRLKAMTASMAAVAARGGRRPVTRRPLDPNWQLRLVEIADGGFSIPTEGEPLRYQLQQEHRGRLNAVVQIDRLRPRVAWVHRWQDGNVLAPMGRAVLGARNDEAGNQNPEEA